MPSHNENSMLENLTQNGRKICNKGDHSKVNQTGQFKHESLDRTRMQFIDESSNDTFMRILPKDSMYKQGSTEMLPADKSYSELLNSLFVNTGNLNRHHEDDKDLPVFSLPLINSSTIRHEAPGDSQMINFDAINDESRFAQDPHTQLLENKEMVNQPILDYIAYKKSHKSPQHLQEHNEFMLNEEQMARMSELNDCPSPTEYWIQPKNLPNEQYKGNLDIFNNFSIRNSSFNYKHIKRW